MADNDAVPAPGAHPAHEGLQLTLIPTLPSHNSTHHGPIQRPAVPLSPVIPAFSQPKNYSEDKDPLPAGWTEHLTPSGLTYYEHLSTRVITSADPRNPVVRTILGAARNLLARKLETIPDGEVFLTILRPTEAPGVVHFYIIDYSTRQPTWAHDTGINRPSGHSDAALLAEHWSHVEHFPNHRPSDRAHEDQLVYQLGSAVIGIMLSMPSTVPFSPDECLHHMSTLGNLQAINSSDIRTYRTASVARLWVQIARHWSELPNPSERRRPMNYPIAPVPAPHAGRRVAWQLLRGLITLLGWKMFRLAVYIASAVRFIVESFALLFILCAFVIGKAETPSWEPLLLPVLLHGAWMGLGYRFGLDPLAKFVMIAILFGNLLDVFREGSHFDDPWITWAIGITFPILLGSMFAQH